MPLLHIFTQRFRLHRQRFGTIEWHARFGVFAQRRVRHSRVQVRVALISRRREFRRQQFQFAYNPANGTTVVAGQLTIRKIHQS